MLFPRQIHNAYGAWMAEIKSTLDIIMERTKNFALTNEEKKVLQTKEWEKKVKGWVCKFVDGKISMQQMKSDFLEGTRENPELRQFLKTELAGNINLEGDNRTIFQLFENILGIDTKPFEDIIKSYKENVQIEEQKRMEDQKRELERNNIHGSSVIPNLDHNDSFRRFLQNMKTDFSQLLISVSHGI
jgi:hypothetical protein